MYTKKYLNDLTYDVIGAVIEVHKEMGSGLLESVYHLCMKGELRLRRINFKTERKVPIIYKGAELDADLRYDLLVEDCFLVELKSVREITSIHEAQLLSYMKLLKVLKAVLINFNCHNIFKEGQRTFVNEYFRDLPE